MSQPSNSTVSVVIPCFNGAIYLREAIDSVLRQTVPPLEVLVVDDGSTDDSAAIAESYGLPVRVIRQQNQGACMARNRGHDEAVGEWVAFLDADDVWETTMTESQLRAVGPDVIAVHTNYYNFNHFSHWYDRNVSPIAPPGVDPYTAANIILRSPFNMSSLMVRQTVSVRSRPGYKNTEEMMYCAELARAGRIVYVDEHLTGYRRHGTSLTASPKFLIDWHQNLCRWLADNPLGLEPTELAAIRTGLLEQLITTTQTAKWHRDWERVSAIRTYLASFRDDPQVAAFLRRAFLPPWVYAVKDRVRALVRRRPRKAT